MSGRAWRNLPVVLGAVLAVGFVLYGLRYGWRPWWAR